MDKIEVGDIVSYWEDGKMKYSWLTVLEINGNNVICSANTLPEDMNERPTHLEKSIVTFKLKDLQLVKKNVV